MVGDILKIKTNVPPLGTNILSRPRIQERLEEDLTAAEGFIRQLTLVSAPAGFGKTTLVRKWLAGREDRTAWYSLNQEDNEPERFWLYLISAMQTVESGVGNGPLEMLRSTVLSSDPSMVSQSLLTPLLNDLFALENPLFLVLDDYHLINNPQIHKDMTFFIENLPPALHLVVTTRSDPAWPLPRWRARRKMAEIRLEELKFSREEADWLFNTCKGLQLDESQVTALYNKTEGWVTGLQLAAFSLSTSRNTEEFINSFAGSHRHVLHFLSEEVFSRQSGDIQDFLLQTSILNRFCAPLCDEVTGKTNSSEVLAVLERDNLFVIPLDDQSTWYRYHQLFADLLLHQLKMAAPDKVDELHEKAGRWFLKEGEPGEAVHHAFSSNNLETAAQIIHEHFDEVMQDKGSSYLNRCLEDFHPELLKKFPRLAAHKAFYRLLRKGREEAKESLELAEELEYENKEEQREYAGIVAAVKAYNNVYTQNFSKVLENAEKALQLLPRESHYWRMSVAVFSGDARLFSGNPKDAYPYYMEARLHSQKIGSHIFFLSSGFKLATTLYYLGRLKEAEEMARDMLQAARKAGLSAVPRAGLLWVLLGELLREKGELEEAERCIERGLFLSRPEKPSLGWNYLFKTALYFTRQEYHNAQKTIKEIETLHSQGELPNFIMFPAAVWKARILLELGEAARGREVLFNAGIKEDNPVQGGQEKGFLVLCRLLMAENKAGPGLAEKYMKPVEELANRGEQNRLLLETLLVKAMAEEQAGSLESAEASLVSALRIGFESGYYQVFHDEGRNLAPVFSRVVKGMNRDSSLRKNRDLLKYVNKISQEMILKESTGETPGTGGRVKKTGEPSYQELVEQLTARELEILHLISQGFSNQDISEKLYLSVGTVKWYTSNIYGKLGVRGRAQAVSRGVTLKLIS